MLSQLQASINMLSSENRKILDENIQLRRENADLKANQGGDDPKALPSYQRGGEIKKSNQ